MEAPNNDQTIQTYYLTARQILDRGLDLLGLDERFRVKNKSSTQVERFKKHYGPHPFHVARIWIDLLTTDIVEAKIQDPSKAKIDHLLMALHFVKCYNEETQHATTFKQTEKTARKWTWAYIQKLAALKALKIKWLDDWKGVVFIASVDGTHCPINEPIDPVLRKNKKWYSHKSNAPAQNWEIALHIYEDRILHTFCSGPAGEYNDIETFRLKLRNMIPNGKKVIADKGYRGEEVREAVFSTANSLDTAEVKEFKGRVRSRHESLNGYLKRYNCLATRFRHGIEKHKQAFDAVSVLVQYEIDDGPHKVALFEA